MKTAVIILMCFFVNISFSQKITNDFFTLHNIIRGDSTYNTFDKQVALIKSSGYDGVEINGEESFTEMKAALDKYQFKGSYFYVKISLEEPWFYKELEAYIRLLKGSNTIISPYIPANRSFPASSHEADRVVIGLMRQLSDWAQASGLQVALYPHLGFYVERTDHALALVKSIDRSNVGMSFNLCHWLATTPLAKRSNLQPDLREMKPYLKMITICGANDVITSKPNVWNDYILPLGTGNFDTYGLVKYCLKDLKLKVPVGVQCFDIKTDKYELVKNTIEVWKAYRTRMEKEK